MKDVISDLCDRMDLLRLRYGVVFRSGTLPPPPYIPMAEALSRGLIREDPAAITTAQSLIDPTEMDRPSFWGTPLGRLMFMAGGFPGDTCTQTAAAEVLSCSRQWVCAMVADGKLTAAMGRAVFVEQVRQVLKNRANRLEIDKAVK